jgi:hypothetical protein
MLEIRTNGFQLKYTREDKLLLAALDVRHNTLSGPATKKLCERAYQLLCGRYKSKERHQAIALALESNNVLIFFLRCTLPQTEDERIFAGSGKTPDQAVP